MCFQQTLKSTILMKMNEKELIIKARDILRKCFEGVPFLKIKSIKTETKVRNTHLDLMVVLDISGQEKKLIIEVKNNGQPRIVRGAINQLFRYKEYFPGAYLIFMAPYISEASAEICKNQGIGYIDLSGNCRVSFNLVYIENRGNPNISAQKRDLRSLYSPKAERILRVLLNNPIKPWKIQNLANEAKVSLGSTANVKKLLMDREWISIDDDGFEIREAEKLLQEWSENYSFQKNNVSNYYSMDDLNEIERKFAKTCKKRKIKYAFTGFSGAARMLLAGRYTKPMIYINKNELNTLIPDLEFKEVDSGANIMILNPYDEGVLYKTELIENSVVASPIQIYLDLKGFRGRGAETADLIFNQIIKSIW
jgi:hypothetical protein